MAINIPLCGKRGTGKFFIVDEEDLHIVAGRKWYLSNRGYAVTTYRDNGKHYLVQLHRLIANPPAGVPVDHVNRNRLDNRHSNLNITTYADNARNRSPHRRSSSSYKGVFLKKGSSTWYAMICYRYQNIFLGSFANAEDAAYVYDQAALQLFGDSAFRNIL